MSFEEIWYELSPYLYVLGGVLALFNDNMLAMVCGLMLMSAAATIIRMRWVHRHPAAPTKRGYAGAQTRIRA